MHINNPDCPIHGHKARDNTHKTLAGRETNESQPDLKLNNGKVTGTINTEQFQQMIDQAVEKRLQTLSSQIIDTLNRMPSGEKLQQFIADQVKASINTTQHDTNNASLRADMLELAKQVNAIREYLNTGKGSFKASSQIDTEDYKRLAPARIQAASLSEIAEFIEGK